MSTEPFIGEIKIFGFNFAPVSYALCQGQIMSIAQNTALFSLLGTTYGGNGQTTFALPDLRGRMPIGQGQGPGLPVYTMGEIGGSTNATLLTQNMPIHNHAATGINVRIPVTSASEDSAAANNYIGNAVNDTFGPQASATDSLGAPVVSGSTALAGGSQPFSILNPYLTINYSIATQGIFPSRN
ncbi:phage tail protein [Flavobacterium terrae]|uniref:Microcystin-dependent protein n=1 Tax=Flavobacterium terrae TaxID=415425 RepID=A0A1M6FKN1_9FLAO|nr:tail fiber protein [Flavobacterium terrae]SHI98225.1 Microcystin-dependent protein [Flavobacterium terrae]